MKSRIKADSRDRKVLRDKLETCIEPLQNDQYPTSLVNIVTGKVVVHPSVNVDDSVKLGKEQMEEFEKAWPAGFHDRINKRVVTMSISHKHVKAADRRVYDIEMIYARAMGLNVYVV